MTSLSLAGHYGRTIAIDICRSCNHVWFDGREDLHLAPGGVVALFEAMGDAAPTARVPVNAAKACPRCGTGLRRTHDRVQQTSYEYFRCTSDHGRFVGFASFLRARHFVRDLTNLEVQSLRVEARVIKCVNCGASTDISAQSTCAYCHAPIAVLDADALSKTLTDLTAAEAARTTLDPSWPLRAERVRRETEAAFKALGSGRGVSPSYDLVETGIAVFARALKGLRR